MHLKSPPTYLEADGPCGAALGSPLSSGSARLTSSFCAHHHSTGHVLRCHHTLTRTSSLPRSRLFSALRPCTYGPCRDLRLSCCKLISSKMNSCNKPSVAHNQLQHHCSVMSQ